MTYSGTCHGIHIGILVIKIQKYPLGRNSPKKANTSLPLVIESERLCSDFDSIKPMYVAVWPGVLDHTTTLETMRFKG